jgi:hypothetical protein
MTTTSFALVDPESRSFSRRRIEFQLCFWVNLVGYPSADNCEAEDHCGDDLGFNLDAGADTFRSLDS